MSLPAMRAARARFPQAHITVTARAWVADLFEREPVADRVTDAAPHERFDTALLLPNSFRSAWQAWRAGIPRRIGYARDGRSLLLTQPVAVPRRGQIPEHQSYYYLELLRRAGWIEGLPENALIRLDGLDAARGAGLARFRKEGLGESVIGVSPGAAFGGAKRWPAERFAEAASRLAREVGGAIAVFGSEAERGICEAVASALNGARVRNYAGATSLGEFIERAAACAVFLTNDSGAMHIASAAGAPVVAVFGATNDAATGPTGPVTRVIREPVDCSPCMLRECPIDHRCMIGVTPERVANVALELLK